MTLALNAAKISTARKLPLADSLILVTAQAYQATLWPQDKGLREFPYYSAKP